MFGAEWAFGHEMEELTDYDLVPWGREDSSGMRGVAQEILGSHAVDSVRGVRLVKRPGNIGLLWASDTPLHETIPWRAAIDLHALRPLQALSIEAATDQQIEHVSQMASLEYLELISYIREPTPTISNLENLKVFDFATRVEEVSWVGGLKEVTDLRIRKVLPARRLLVDVSFLGEMTQLKRLRLEAIRLSGLDSLGSLRQLERLELVHASAIDVAVLEGLAIKELTIMDTPIRNLQSLVSLESLTVLDLSGVPMGEQEWLDFRAGFSLQNPSCKLVRDRTFLEDYMESRYK